MEKKKSKVTTEYTRCLNKLRLLSWSSPIYPHGKGKYQHKIFEDNIPGYPGYYISKRGKVYSRWDINGKGIMRNRYHKKIPHLNKNGRYIVGLSQPGIGRTNWLVSRLVALVYIPNPENKSYVCHKDNNPLNNSIDNLYWGTQKENMEQASRDKRFPDRRCIKKGTEIQRSYIPRLKEVGFSYKEISEILNLSRVRVRDYYNAYRNLKDGSNYYVHNKRNRYE